MKLVKTLEEYLLEMAKNGAWLLTTDLILMAKIKKLNILFIQVRQGQEFVESCHFGESLIQSPFFLVRSDMYIFIQKVHIYV